MSEQCCGEKLLDHLKETVLTKELVLGQVRRRAERPPEHGWKAAVKKHELDLAKWQSWEAWVAGKIKEDG